MWRARAGSIAAPTTGSSGSPSLARRRPPEGRLPALDELDAVVVRVADEADLRAAGVRRVRRLLGRDAVLGEPRELGVHPALDGQGDVPVGVAVGVGLLAAVVERELELVVVAGDGQEDHGRGVPADPGAATLLEAQGAVEVE